MAAERRHWLDGAEYALSELGLIERRPGERAPLATIVISEKTGLPLRLTARAAPGHGSMPWPETAPHRLSGPSDRLIAADRPLACCPRCRRSSPACQALPAGQGPGYGDLEGPWPTPTSAPLPPRPHHAALVRATFAVTKLRGSEKSNVIPPEAAAEVDCRMLADDDPAEIGLGRARGGGRPGGVETLRPPKQPNMSPPDTELYKHLADTLGRRAPGALVAPEIMAASPTTGCSGVRANGLRLRALRLDEEERGRIHGNDERISVENPRGRARCYTEMLLAAAEA